jgi:hypothetical protein
MLWVYYLQCIKLQEGTRQRKSKLFHKLQGHYKNCVLSVRIKAHSKRFRGSSHDPEDPRMSREKHATRGSSHGSRGSSQTSRWPKISFKSGIWYAKQWQWRSDIELNSLLVRSFIILVYLDNLVHPLDFSLRKVQGRSSEFKILHCNA